MSSGGVNSRDEKNKCRRIDRSAGAIFEKKVEYTELSDERGSYFAFPNAKDIKEFKKKGYKIV